MEHEEIRQKLSAYLDNAVNVEEKAEIKRHLGGCGSCRGAIADLDLTIGYIKSLPEIEPPSWLTTKIMARVMDKALPRPGLWQRLFLPLHVKLPIEALIVSFLCITGYYHAWIIGSQVPQTKLSTLRQHALAPPPVMESPASIIIRNKMKSPHPATLPPLVMAPSPITTLPELEAPPTRPTEHMPEPELLPENEDMMSESGGTQPLARDEKGAVPSAVNRSGDAPAVESTTADKVEVALTVDDPEGAARTIEEIVARVGGRISGHSYGDDTHLLLIRIGAQNMQELLARLARIGTVREGPQLATGTSGSLDLSISW
jgi:hypothetical protein